MEEDNDLPQLPPIVEYRCECGKSYKYKSGLCKHKKKCIVVQNPPSEDNISNQFLKDEMIERLVKELGDERKALIEKNNENQEMKSMFLMMIEKYQQAAQEANQQLANTIVKGNQETTKELVNKFIEIAPKMGNNTTNNNDNRKITFNYYLTNHCKDAETIHDFIDRYSLKCGDYFRENARAIVDRQVSLADNAHRLFFECLRENPQHMNFVQTSNVHDGIHYVKEKERIKENDIITLYGEAEFRKYTDKFQKKGFEISSAVYRVLRVIQEETYERFKRNCRKKPQESDYEGQYSDYVSEYMRDMEDYNNQYEYSTEHNCSLKTALMDQVFSVINLFDTTKPAGKKTCKEILEMSRYSTKSQLLC